MLAGRFHITVTQEEDLVQLFTTLPSMTQVMATNSPHVQMEAAAIDEIIAPPNGSLIALLGYPITQV